jgi:hypothetical protein
MSDRAATTGHRPLFGTARARYISNAVTVDVVSWLGARLAIADPAERAARSLGGARG